MQAPAGQLPVLTVEAEDPDRPSQEWPGPGGGMPGYIFDDFQWVPPGQPPPAPYFPSAQVYPLAMPPLTAMVPMPSKQKPRARKDQGIVLNWRVPGLVKRTLEIKRKSSEQLLRGCSVCRFRRMRTLSFG